MTRHKKLVPLFQLGIAITAIILLSTGLSELKFSSGRLLDLFTILLRAIKRLFKPAPLPASNGGDDYSLDLLIPVFWVLFVFSIIYAVISPQYRKLLLRTFLTLVMLSVVIFLVSEKINQPQPQADIDALEETEVELPDPPSFITDPPGWFLLAANVLLVFLFLGGIWFSWNFLRPKPDAQRLLAQEAQVALADLEAGGDLENVVLRCYARMSQVLRQSQNIERDRAMTPREFERHLTEVGFRDEHIQRLTCLFEEVRYGARPSGRRVEREAMDCLKAIIRTYGKVT